MTAANSKKLSTEQIFGYQREGYEAYLTGVSPRNNPYKYGEPGSEPWRRGYAQARTDRAIENRKITP